MKIVIQRSLKASVKVGEEIVNSIDRGMVLLVCCEKGDTLQIAKKAADKILNLRIFIDPKIERMSHNISQTRAEILAISQFTLAWDGKKGNRPGFDNSMAPDEAKVLFDQFCDFLAEKTPTKKGVFGAKMLISLENDGPVTFSLNFSE